MDTSRKKFMVYEHRESAQFRVAERSRVPRGMRLGDGGSVAPGRERDAVLELGDRAAAGAVAGSRAAAPYGTRNAPAVGVRSCDCGAGDAGTLARDTVPLHEKI